MTRSSTTCGLTVPSQLALAMATLVRLQLAVALAPSSALAYPLACG
mgnify:CR=1 FL=1